MTTFQNVLDKFRHVAYSEKIRFKIRRLITIFTNRAYYANIFQKVWLWEEFPYRKDLGGNDTGIDIVAKTNHGAY